MAAFAGRINLNEDQWDLFNLAGFTCATARAVEHRVRERIPTWRYRYFAEFPNLRLYPGSGAFHGSEIPMIFDTAPDISLEPNTPEQEALSDYMMSAWAAFARDPRAGLTGLGWPEYNPQGTHAFLDISVSSYSRHRGSRFPRRNSCSTRLQRRCPSIVRGSGAIRRSLRHCPERRVLRAGRLLNAERIA